MKSTTGLNLLTMMVFCGCVQAGPPVLGEGEAQGSTSGGEVCDGVPCGGECCEPGSLCSAGACVVAGSACSDLSPCPEGQYCDYGLVESENTPTDVCAPNAPPLAGLCLPRPELCAPGADPLDGDEPCAGTCEIMVGSSAPIDLKVKYEWTGRDVMTTPIVIQLNDDNCNGKVDGGDLPEIIVASVQDPVNWWEGSATLHALSIQGGGLEELWSVRPDDFDLRSHSFAAGNVDGSPGNEIVVCSSLRQAAVYGSDGKRLWLSAEDRGCYWPSLFDLAGDGDVEVLTSSMVFDGDDGALELGELQSIDIEPSHVWFLKRPIPGDVNGDGSAEIVLPNKVFDASGKILAESTEAGNFAALADLDGDGGPELVVAHVDQKQTARFSIWKYVQSDELDLVPIRQGILLDGPLPASICPVDSYGYNGVTGGFPTLADLNRDNVPDVLVAGGRGLVAFDGAALVSGTPEGDAVLWSVEAGSCHGGLAGSTVFDFEGDGYVEVIYNDQEMLRIYDGGTGAIRAEVCNVSNNQLGAPVVADVDGDGRAEIIVSAVSNPNIECPAQGGPVAGGVRVFDAPSTPWALTRRVWNEELYRVTNVEDDGSIPAKPKSNWKEPGLNGFRTNLSIPVERAKPDLRVEVSADCSESGFRAFARVGNSGQSMAPAGVAVEFFAGSPEEGQSLGTLHTNSTLGPGQTEELTLDAGTVPLGFVDGSKSLTVRLVGDAVSLPQGECSVENNVQILDQVCV